MLLKDIKDVQILNQHDVLAQGIYCYEEQISVEYEDVNYMNKEGEGVYSIWSGTRGEYEIEKITDEKMLKVPLYEFDGTSYEGIGETMDFDKYVTRKLPTGLSYESLSEEEREAIIIYGVMVRRPIRRQD